MTQKDLFGIDSEQSLPYAKGRETSKAAAESMLPHAGTLRAMVYDEIKARGSIGATSDEIEHVFDMLHQTISPRVYELAKAGFIVDSGKRRSTRSYRRAIVWIAAT